jgi:hypothetical protein
MTMLKLRREKSGVYRCGYCGWIVDDQAEPWKSTCPVCPSRAESSDGWKPIMLGDLLERGLTSIGITKSLVTRLTRTEGKPGGCGCQGRQKWLNTQGVKAQRLIRSALHRARDFYLGSR